MPNEPEVLHEWTDSRGVKCYLESVRSGRLIVSPYEETAIPELARLAAENRELRAALDQMTLVRLNDGTQISLIKSEGKWIVQAENDFGWDGDRHARFDSLEEATTAYLRAKDGSAAVAKEGE